MTISLGPARTKTRRRIIRSEAEADGWFGGPPYAVAERVFDEYDQHPCAFDADGTGEGNGEVPTGVLLRGPYSEARRLLRERRNADRSLKAASEAGRLPPEQV